jgi:hypothetical protein
MTSSDVAEYNAPSYHHHMSPRQLALFVPSLRGLELVLLLTASDGLVVWDRLNRGTAGL